MKILHLNNERTWRGGERQTLLLAAALPQFGIEGSIACRPGGPLAERAVAQKIPTINLSGNSIAAMWQLARIARGFDLIHCHTGRGHSLAAATAFIHRKPVIVTRRVDFPPNKSSFNCYKYRTAWKVVCISEFIAQQLAEWGLPAQKLTVIRSAVPISVPNAQSSERAAQLRAKLGIPASTKLVGNIGALVGHKDQATLLRAAQEVHRERKGVAFVVVGDGELKHELLRLREELGLTKTVHFTGFIPRAEELLPAFDVFVMPSCMEGLGSIVLDAFAAGVPVAATAGGGLPELVRDGKTGLLVAAGDHEALAKAIVKLIEDPQSAGRLSMAAQQWMNENCTVEKMAESYGELYRECLANAPS